MSKPLARVLYRPQQCEYITSSSRWKCANSAIITTATTTSLHSSPPTSRHGRPFSSSSPWQASVMGKSVKPSGRKQRAPSMEVQKAEQRAKAMREGLLPDDIGLLPDTFVMPRGGKRPSWFGDFKGRWYMERRRFSTRVQEATSAFIYRFWMVRPMPRLHLRQIAPTAKQLHHDMYTAFAAGSLGTMESQICNGLLSSLRGRVAQRAPNTSLRWTLHRYLSRPRLMSYKAALIPSPKGARSDGGKNGFIQAVVRIHSLQSLRHVKKVSVRAPGGTLATKEVPVDAQGMELAAEEVERETKGGIPANAKETVEYLVLQKALRVGKEGSWMVWGTAEEMTLDRLRAGRQSAQESPLARASG